MGAAIGVVSSECNPRRDAGLQMFRGGEGRAAFETGALLRVRFKPEGSAERRVGHVWLHRSQRP